MDSSNFASALRNDPAARVFIDRFGLPSTAHLVGGVWVAHACSTEPGDTVAEDRLFDAGNVWVWRNEADRVFAHYYRELVEVCLPEAPRLPDMVRTNLQGEVETYPIYGDRVVTMPRDEVATFLAEHPGAVEI